MRTGLWVIFSISAVYGRDSEACSAADCSAGLKRCNRGGRVFTARHAKNNRRKDRDSRGSWISNSLWQALWLRCLLCVLRHWPGRAIAFTIGDVPLAEGLQELPDAGFVFDKPQGRIVQLTASHQAGVTQQALMAFYRDSLPIWVGRLAKPPAC